MTATIGGPSVERAYPGMRPSPVCWRCMKRRVRKAGSSCFICTQLEGRRQATYDREDGGSIIVGHHLHPRRPEDVELADLIETQNDEIKMETEVFDSLDSWQEGSW